jgi:hypothetical protein
MIRTIEFHCFKINGMSYIKHDTLIKKIIARAIDDRESFVDAVRNDIVMVEKTQREMAQIKALEGLPLNKAIEIDKAGVIKACIYAEQYYRGLADAQTEREAAKAMMMFKVVKKFRIRRFGITELESRMSKMIPLSLSEIVAKFL